MRGERREDQSEKYIVDVRSFIVAVSGGARHLRSIHNNDKTQVFFQRSSLIPVSPDLSVPFGCSLGIFDIRFRARPRRLLR